ncbi:Silent information regulator protein Sir2 [Pyrobaculum islandicum DSM 4184]|uniref:NAD-dependent protein deacylase n=1 Tax=Pyrobaculum islandicum (strain DSM 4184 / JCM 9189 / GEO3) TaxID=384616 RepID=A1RSN7_PYRIL|nr:NAD-dependent protein deacetylase [Pyrobaculum islandicum]ABL87969.1 Silent information regulator protein Sir2 [Pyrobaculum islandicum DSM 4184]
MDVAVLKAAELVHKSAFCIAFTGAGISAESGVPTFRGAGGLWERYKPEELATPEAFERNPELVWRWYRWRQELVYNAKPNPGHLALAELENLGVIKAIITQNVDGLHQRAGSKNVVELHGSLWRARCVKCGLTYRLERPVEEILPRCPNCGGLLRPDVVWFGEPLPQDVWNKAVELAHKSDVVLVIGTSGVVYPAAYIPHIAKRNGALVIEINTEESAITPIADIFIKGRAGVVLPALVREIRRRLSTRHG